MEVSVGSTLAVDIVDMRVLWYPLADGYGGHVGKYWVHPS